MEAIYRGCFIICKVRRICAHVFSVFFCMDHSQWQDNCGNCYLWSDLIGSFILFYLHVWYVYAWCLWWSVQAVDSLELKLVTAVSCCAGARNWELVRSSADQQAL